MVLTLGAIAGVVTAIVKYLGISKGVETASEKITEKARDALTDAGKQALDGIKQALVKRGDNAKKANKALKDVEEDPADKEYQEKLATELQKLATHDVDLSNLLEHLSTITQQAQSQISDSNVQGQVNVSEQGKVYGPTAGTNLGTMSGTYNFKED